MVKYLLLFSILISQSEIISQSDLNTEINEKEYVLLAEEMPKPIGGTEGIASKLIYTEEAKEEGIEGKIFIQAFINENGDVTKVKLIKGLGFGLDQNALETIYNTKFIPGKNKGKPVKILILIPVQFTLD